MARVGDTIFNEAEINRILNSQDGPVARDLAERAVRVESRAKLNASGRPGPNVQTGRLRASISWTLGRDSQGIFAVIGTNVEYAYFVEQLYPYLRPALAAAV